MATETVINRPAPFVEDIGKKLKDQALAIQDVPVVTTGPGGLTRAEGETEQGFLDRQNAARAFEVRQQNLAGLRPEVAKQTGLQRAAEGLAVQGLGSFEPFLNRAQAQATVASDLGTAALQGIGATQAQLGGVGLGPITAQQLSTIDPATGQTITPQLAAGSFMSPYQSQVIEASLAEFDRNRAIQERNIRDQQAKLGVLGTGRAGVQLAEYGTGADRERFLLQSGLLQQGFNQAQAARQQDIANRFGLAQAQSGIASQLQGLGGFRSGLAGQQAQLGQGLQQLQGTDISRLGQLGALNQAQKQAELDATREFTRMAAFQPQEELNRFADITTGIMGGMRGTGTSTTNIPNPTPLQTALGVGSTLAGIYGAFKNPSGMTFNLPGFSG